MATPPNIRQVTKMMKVGARALPKEVAANKNAEAMSSRLRPNLSLSAPATRAPMRQPITGNSGKPFAECGFGYATVSGDVRPEIWRGKLVLGMRRDELMRAFVRRHPFASTFAIVDTIIKCLAEWVPAHCAFGMVSNIMNVRREKALIPFMNARGDIGPPQECLHQRRTVISPHLQFDARISGMQANSVHAFHARHGVMVTAPNGLRTVRVCLNLIIYRQKGCGPMMLGPIEFYAAGDPRPGQTDQCRLDNMLVVNQIVAVGLVLNAVDAPANFRQHQYAEIIILDPDGLPCSIDRLFGDAINERQRVYLAAAALVNPLFQKHWILVGLLWQVGRNDQLFNPDADLRIHAHT